jgi:hypothetical protein
MEDLLIARATLMSTPESAAARLLAEIGEKTPIDTKVGRLVDELVLSDRNRVQMAVTALTMLGQAAVPSIVGRIDDRRSMPVRVVVFENRSPNAFEAVRQYGVFQVVDCLNDVLNELTGEFFGFVDDMAPESRELDTKRAAIVAGWRGYLARRRAMPRAPGKTMPVAEWSRRAGRGLR